MSLSSDPLSLFAAPDLVTDPGDLRPLLDGLSGEIPALCQVVQGLLIHPLVTDLYGVDLTSTQK